MVAKKSTKNSEKQEKATPEATVLEKFGAGLGYEKLSMVFIIGCIFGDVYEIVLNFFMHLFQNGEIFLERRSATIYGPFSVIYGAGAVLLAKVLAERGLKWWQLFLRGAVVAGLAEIVIGYLQIWFTGTSSWNYSDHFLNFADHLSSPRILLIWGFVSLFFIKVCYPLICKLSDKIPKVAGRKVLNFVMVLLVLDMLLSFSAVVRYSLRHDGHGPITPYGQFLDTVYNDERMRSAYPNMEFVD